MTTRSSRLGLILILSVTPLFSKETKPDKTVHFRTFGATAATHDLFYHFKGADTKVAVIESARSIFLDHEDKGPITFYRLVPKSEGKFEREEVASASIEGAGASPLLIFTETADSPKHYQIRVVADDLKAFPFPFCRFINLSPIAIDVSYGGESLHIPPQAIEMIDPRLETSDQPETRYTTLTKPTQNGPVLLYSNNWVVSPNQRTMVVISEEGEGITVTRIVDDKGQYAPLRTKSQ